MWPAIAPDVPIAFGVRAILARFPEPRMLVGGVVRNEIQDDLDMLAVRLLNEVIEIRECAEEGVDVDVVADVVSEIHHRRWEDWRNPDGVHAEPLEVVQFLRNARDVAGPVGVGVHERTRVNLINQSPLPPRMISSHLAISVGPAA